MPSCNSELSVSVRQQCLLHGCCWHCCCCCRPYLYSSYVCGAVVLLYVCLKAWLFSYPLAWLPPAALMTTCGAFSCLDVLAARCVLAQKLLPTGRCDDDQLRGLHGVYSGKCFRHAHRCVLTWKAAGVHMRAVVAFPYGLARMCVWGGGLRGCCSAVVCAWACLWVA